MATSLTDSILTRCSEPRLSHPHEPAARPSSSPGRRAVGSTIARVRGWRGGPSLGRVPEQARWLCSRRAGEPASGSEHDVRRQGPRRLGDADGGGAGAVGDVDRGVISVGVVVEVGTGEHCRVGSGGDRLIVDRAEADGHGALGGVEARAGGAALDRSHAQLGEVGSHVADRADHLELPPDRTVEGDVVASRASRGPEQRVGELDGPSAVPSAGGEPGAADGVELSGRGVAADPGVAEAATDHKTSFAGTIERRGRGRGGRPRLACPQPC
jgi:hypothetical protein